MWAEVWAEVWEWCKMGAMAMIAWWRVGALAIMQVAGEGKADACYQYRYRRPTPP